MMPFRFICRQQAGFMPAGSMGNGGREELQQGTKACMAGHALLPAFPCCRHATHQQSESACPFLPSSSSLLHLRSGDGRVEGKAVSSPLPLSLPVDPAFLLPSLFFLLVFAGKGVTAESYCLQKNAPPPLPLPAPAHCLLASLRCPTLTMF